MTQKEQMCKPNRLGSYRAFCTFVDTNETDGFVNGNFQAE
jgi:hypothetical protein